MTRPLLLALMVLLLCMGAGAPLRAEPGSAPASALVPAPAPAPWQREPGRSVVRAAEGMVASSQPLASQVGIGVLRRGGNAVDAAVAMAAALAVLEPGMSGLGGDAAALVYWAQAGAVRALNATGRAPAALTRERLVRRGLDRVPLMGHDSVTVPGAVAGWVALHRTYGSLPFRDLLEPAIAYAEQGFPVMEKTAEDWAAFGFKLAADPAARAALLVDGRAPRAGERLRQPDLARTLRQLAAAADPHAVFYRGAVGQAIVAGAARSGGLLTAADLAAQRAEWVEPISADYRGHRVYQCPPNSQGLTALLALNILQGLDLAELSARPVAYYHALAEALTLALSDRDRHVADPAFAPVPVGALLTPAYAARRRALLRPDQALSTAPSTPLSADTTYVAVVDRRRNVVSYIGSLFMMFGSGVVAGDTGVLLQDRAAGFSLDPGHPNCLAPGKRPLHTIMPGLVLRGGRPWLALGVVGGDMQPQAQVQVLSGLIDLKLPLQQALEAPRLLVSGAGRVVFEASMPESIIRGLGALGHVSVAPPPPLSRRAAMGGVQAVLVGADELQGASDPRKDGAAMGL